MSSCAARSLLLLLIVMLLLGAGQGNQPVSQARVVNVNTVVRGGVVHVFYDLLADPTLGATFTVVLEVWTGGGKSFDVSGACGERGCGGRRKPGRDRHIIWDATKDTERVDPEQLRYQITVQPESSPREPVPTANEAARTSTLVVVSRPPGAAVYLDGKPWGETPVELSGVSPGDLNRPGFPGGSIS